MQPVPAVAASEAASKVGRTALAVAPVVIAARGVAFLVPVAIASLYGADATTDAFFYALAFPTFVMIVMANAFGLVAAVRVAELQARDPARLAAFVGDVFLTGALAATAVGVGFLLLLYPLLPYITSFDAETRRLTFIYVAELVPFMATIGGSLILRSACEVRGRFVAAAWSPMLRGLTVLITLVSLRGALGPHALALSMLCGQLVEIVWYLGILAHGGLVPRPSLRLGADLRGALRDVLPVLGGEAMVATNLVVDRGFAGILPPGSVSVLEYADRTRLIPQSLLENTILAVAFATWSNQVARGERAAYAAQVDQSLRWVAALTAPVLSGLFIGRHVLVTLLYERGAFDAADSEAAASAFGWYVPGLWVMFLGSLGMRAALVERRMRLVLWLGLVSAAANVALDAALVGPMGVDGVALGSTILWAVVAGAYLLALAPTLRPVADVPGWLAALGVAAASAGVAIAVEITTGAPRSLLDGSLWAAAVACFALLAVGWRVSRARAR